MNHDDCLLRNGCIYTMDERDTVAEAVLIRDGHIVAVGPAREVERLAHPGAAAVDLRGACVLPGLIDTHPHLLHYGTLEAPLVPLWDCRSHAEIVERLTARARETEPGEWIQATPVGEPHFFFRRSYRDLEEGVLPDRHVLDRASSHHPIVVQAWAPVRPSCMAFNSMALERLGIRGDAPEHLGNVWIDKDASGAPTGLVSGAVVNYYAFDSFAGRLWNAIPFLDLDQVAPGTLRAIDAYHRQGVTGVYENHMMEPVLIAAYQALRRDEKLAMRVLVSQEAESYGMPFSEERSMPELVALLEHVAASIDVGDARLRIDGLTIMWDGYCFGGAQMMRAPYLDAFGRMTRGHRHITPEKAELVMRFCAQRRLHLNLLVMGLAAHDEMLALVESVALDHDLASLGWTLVHATTIEASQVARYERLGFSVTTSMTFAYGEGDLMRRSMGSRVLADLVPLGRFVEAGMAVAGSTDWGPKNPWEQIQLASTHELGESGLRNLGDAQRISRTEAVAMFTRNAARVMRWPEIGVLRAGNRADLVVVDRDPIRCEVDTIAATRVLRTIFDGTPVHDSGELS
jgi:predicted amidohydrolase YtcJ